MLNYLSGISGPRRQAKKTAKVAAKAQRKEIKQVSRQKRVAKSMPVKLLKAVAKQSKVAAQKIAKQHAVNKQRRVFKKAGEPATVSPEMLNQEENLELDIPTEEGTAEVDSSEFPDSDTGGENMPEDNGDLGIIYPDDYQISGKGKAKRQAKKAAKAPAKAVKKENRKVVLQKVGKAALSVAKATLEAKGVKFPTNTQIQEEVSQQTPPEKTAGGGMLTPIILGGAAIGLFLMMKKK